MTTSTHLSPAQCRVLRQQLLTDLRRLDERLAAQFEGQQRVDHAHDLLAREGDEINQHEAERAMDFALAERHEQAIAAMAEALRRLDEHSYGLCRDCDEPIPYRRLKAEPWALRCVDCEASRERHRP